MTAPKKQHVRIRKGKHGYYWIIFNGGGALAVSLKRWTSKQGAKKGFKSTWQHIHMEIIYEC
jgi:hypothetical protein